LGRARAAEGEEESGLMRLTDYIVKKRINLSVNVKNKNLAIRHVTELFGSSGIVKDLPGTVARVLERESYESCGIGHGVAIPHARCTGLKNLACAIGRLKKPVDFVSFDGEPVNLVFVILYSTANTAKYLLFISSLTRLLQEEEVRRKLLSAKTPAEFYSVFEQADIESGEICAKTPARRTKAAAASTSQEPPEMLLLIRLQRLETLKQGLSKKKATAIQLQIDNVRACIKSETLRRFDMLMKRSKLAVVAAEGAMCQGCNMKLPSAFAQKLRKGNKLATCPSCKRFLFFVGEKE
jgi:mannitol/fructose-specific phosphotransferase system IIA component (Ntr-type)